jgi:rare lipoprotein A (peptidoglycan hydrolase)
VLKTTIRKKRVVLGFACAAMLALSASSAQAQTGGTVTPTVEPTSPPASSSSGTYTVYKKATWYGPGLWGNNTACGMVLQPTVIGTAHKGLPCGTQVTFTYAGRSVAATVIDRGPFRKGYAWDLTKKAAKRVGFLAVGSGKIAATVTAG